MGCSHTSVPLGLDRTGDEALNPTDVQPQDTINIKSEMRLIPIADLLTAVWQRRRWLATVTGSGLLIAICVARLIPDEYSSTARLMPPDQQTFSSGSLLNAQALAGTTSNLPGGVSSLMNQRTPGATALGVLSSNTVEDDIINRFDLRSAYHCKLYVDARKELAKRSTFDEDKKTGIISITVKDRDRFRARDIAQSYVEELNRLINSLSTSSARREREFLEERLKSIKNDLDASSLALSQFSSRNATLNLQAQGDSTVAAAARVQGELITAESELSALKAMYTDDNVRVRAARARIDELQSQLKILGGQEEKGDGANLKGDQVLPSVRELPILGVTYYDLYRKVNMDSTLYETLTKQYELARVQEVEDIPPIKVLDPPEAPEKRSSPHRIMIALLGSFISALVGMMWIIAAKLWEISEDSSPVKMYWRSMFVRSRSKVPE